MDHNGPGPTVAAPYPGFACPSSDAARRATTTTSRPADDAGEANTSTD